MTGPRAHRREAVAQPEARWVCPEPRALSATPHPHAAPALCPGAGAQRGRERGRVRRERQGEKGEEGEGCGSGASAPMTMTGWHPPPCWAVAGGDGATGPTSPACSIVRPRRPDICREASGHTVPRPRPCPFQQGGAGAPAGASARQLTKLRPLWWWSQGPVCPGIVCCHDHARARSGAQRHGIPQRELRGSVGSELVILAGQTAPGLAGELTFP